VTKTNLQRNKNEGNEIAEDIKLTADICQEINSHIELMMPNMSIQEFLLQDEIEQAMKQMEFFDYKSSHLENAVDKMQPQLGETSLQKLDDFKPIAADQQRQIQQLKERLLTIRESEI